MTKFVVTPQHLFSFIYYVNMKHKQIEKKKTKYTNSLLNLQKQQTN